MSDMTRHDIYGHELKALEFYVKQMLELPKEQVPTPYLEVTRIIEKVKATDAGPLPRGERTLKQQVQAAIIEGLKTLGEHTEIKVLDVSTVQVFVRPKDGVVFDFVIKIQQPR